METTRLTLLQRAGQGASEAWHELDRFYRPFIHGWFCQQGLIQDADDLTQEVITALFQVLPQFEHSQQRGAFRCWLRVACKNRLLNHLRNTNRKVQAIGGTNFHEKIQALVDKPDSYWDREHDKAILKVLFAKLAVEFDAKTLKAFQLMALDCLSAAEVAKRIGMTVGATYVAKSRVLRRLHEEAKELIDLDTLT